MTKAEIQGHAIEGTGWGGCSQDPRKGRHGQDITFVRRRNNTVEGSYCQEKLMKTLLDQGAGGWHSGFTFFWRNVLYEQWLDFPQGK